MKQHFDDNIETILKQWISYLLQFLKLEDLTVIEEITKSAFLGHGTLNAHFLQVVKLFIIILKYFCPLTQMQVKGNNGYKSMKLDHFMRLYSCCKGIWNVQVISIALN